MINVVIAEDHQSLIDGLKLLLDYDKEINVLATAMDGIELLEVIKHRKPDVVVTDISMPRMNGVELCTQIKKDYPDTKVIAFSMFENDEAILDMMDAGVSGYVLKRRSIEEVATAIKAVHAGERYFDPSIDIAGIEKKDKSKSKTILSKSERAILKLIAAGKTNSEIAAERFTAVSTVEKHRKNMIEKLGLKGKGRDELLRYALQMHEHYK